MKVTVYAEGYAVGHLKHTRLVQVAGSSAERSIIETSLQELASARPT
jgi:hypothetical protein